ncbi:MAG: cytochrome c556 [Woeseiaceae bacterium]|jgi:cytochrome c556
MHCKIISLLASLGVVLGVSYQALADTTPEDAADYRRAVMTSLRGHIGAASMIVRGLVESDAIVSHAKGLASGAREMDHLFPAGSNVGESEALPAIWEKPEEFAGAIAKAQEATAAFVTAAESGDPDTIGMAFRNVGMACRGCHDNFRVAHD